MLSLYDLLVAKNQSVIETYLKNILDLNSQFCLQADSGRILTASGSKYTTIQAQGIDASTNLSSDGFAIAGSGSNHRVCQYLAVYWSCVADLVGFVLSIGLLQLVVRRRDHLQRRMHGDLLDLS